MRTLSFFIFLAIALPLRAQPPSQHVIFSEIMWMGSSQSSADEWIELYNTSDIPQDLSNWVLTRITPEGEQVMIVIENGQIDPGQTFLIANYGADNEKSQLASPPHLVDAALSLPNNKLQVRLYTGLPENGATLIDIADDGTGAPFAGDSEQKRSMVRINLLGDGTKAENWATAKEINGWDQGAQEMGTPGSLPSYLLSVDQPTMSTAVQYKNWAKIKQP